VTRPSGDSQRTIAAASLLPLAAVSTAQAATGAKRMARLLRRREQCSDAAARAQGALLACSVRDRAVGSERR
jgi:hypothetical protein